MVRFPIPSVVHVGSFFLYTSVFLPPVVPLEGLLKPLLSSNRSFLVLTSVQQPHRFQPCAPMFCWWADVTLLSHWGWCQRSQTMSSFSGCCFAPWPCDPSCLSVHGLNWNSHTVGALLCLDLCSEVGHSAVSPPVCQSSEMSLSWIWVFGV